MDVEKFNETLEVDLKVLNLIFTSDETLIKTQKSIQEKINLLWISSERCELPKSAPKGFIYFKQEKSAKLLNCWSIWCDKPQFIGVTCDEAGEVQIGEQCTANEKTKEMEGKTVVTLKGCS